MAGAPRITDRDPLLPGSGRSGPVPLGSIALRGLCPRCGASGLFAGPTAFAPHCRACGLDYRSFDVGDGPAAFLIFLVGGLTVGFAAAVELAWSPPFWVHILLWPPFALLLVIVTLRLAKALLLALAWRHDAREGRSPGHE